MGCLRNICINTLHKGDDDDDDDDDDNNNNYNNNKYGYYPQMNVKFDCVRSDSKETSVFLRSRDFLYLLSDWQLLRKDSMESVYNIYRSYSIVFLEVFPFCHWSYLCWFLHEIIAKQFE